MTPPRVLLVGMMGAGKTTVGELLSARTGWPYYDNDTLLSIRAGRPTAEVLATDGVARLRALEAAVLRDVLARPAPLVAGVAGGVVDDPVLLDLLRGDAAVVVWLRAAPAALAARVAAGGPRPWLPPDADPVAVLDELGAGRAQRYASVADLVVDTDERPAAAVVEEILGQLGGSRLIGP